MSRNDGFEYPHMQGYYYVIKVYIFTPCARMCSRGKAIDLSVRYLSSVVRTKIARSRHLGTSAIRKHNESVEIVDKLASLCFESLGKAHERRKYGVLLGTPINRAPMCLVHNLVSLLRMLELLYST
jgi:hypothetical protein